MPRYGIQAFFWFVIALVLRLVIAAVLFVYSDSAGYGGFFPFESGSDDSQYYYYAKTIGEGRSDSLEWYPTSYPLVLGTIYQYTGPSLVLGIFINVVVGAA